MTEHLIINGGRRLTGSVAVGGSKNAAVAIIPAVLLSDGVCKIENVPDISDVAAVLSILQTLGAKVRYTAPHTVEIDPAGARSYTLTAFDTSSMRASSYFIGALLGRFGRARVAPPGGCDFGVRPIDQHIKGFEALGARVVYEDGMVDARAKALTGCTVYLDKVSVGATINIMLAAVKADGLTVIENAAREPHIVDTANFLNSMGADIMGAGTGVIKIRGVKHLHGTEYSVIPDQIEAGTYMLAAAATRGDVLVENIIPKHLEAITAKLTETGVRVTEYDDSVRVTAGARPRCCSVTTLPHPGFPTDMQPQITAYLATAIGTSVITESVWDNRFRYTDGLTVMGARISVDGKIAVVSGVRRLSGSPVHATDLRAGAALVIAGLSASGVTEIDGVKFIDRGYEHIEEKLAALGADIKRIRIAPYAVADAG